MRGTKGRREDAAVTQAYLRRITGYDVTEVKEEFKVNEDGELELLKKTEKTKHIPGDPRAAEFWLTNRQPEKWRYRRGNGADKEGTAEPGEAGIIELPPIEALPEESEDGEDEEESGDG